MPSAKARFLLSVLLLATAGPAHGILFFRASFDPELLPGRWTGSQVHEVGEGDSYSWDLRLHPDGTFDSEFHVFETGRLEFRYALEGTWQADAYGFTIHAETRTGADGITWPDGQSFSYRHIHLDDRRHEYKLVSEGITFEALRMD